MAMTTFYEEIRKNKLKSAFLVSGFIAVVLLLGYFVGLIWGRDYAMFGLLVATLIAIVMSLVSYYHSDKIALASVGARPVTREEYPYYVNTVEGLALAAGIPMPRTYIIETPAMNAFATGRDPEHAAIAVTTGLLERCNRLELEGVIAHEISHIKNYDIRLMSMVVVLVGLVVIFSEIMLRSLFFGGGRRRSEGEGQGEGVVYLVLMLLGLAFLIISPILAQLLQLAISRRREFLADASAAMLTRYPEGLASALEKLTVEAKPFPQASNAVAHLFIVQPFRARVKPGKRYKTSIWDTHPPVEERIRRLRAMAGLEGMRGPEQG
ncbi:MAG: M48 family metalloprotease [Candidatus Geothermincolales bacterium]